MKKKQRHHKNPALLRVAVWTMTILTLIGSVPPSAVLAASKDAIKAVSSMAPTGPAPRHESGPRAKKNFKVTKGTLSFSAAATDDEIRLARVFGEPLVPMPDKAVAGENQALVSAIKAFEAKKDNESISDLTAFLTKYPKSRWHAALELDLGLLRYQTGYVSDALKYWQAAWNETKAEKGQAQIAIANRAYGELAIAKSRLGRKAEVQKLIDEAGDRPLYGSTAERIKNAKYGVWAMDNLPGDSFKCGPCAVGSIENLGKKTKIFSDVIRKAKSSAKGTSLSQIKDLSAEVGLNYQAAKRSPGAPILVPSVLHWKVGHYAAILSESNGKYFLNDPTFDQAGNRLMSAKALEAESDGYFLVRPGALPSGWTSVSKNEADKVWGKGEALGWDFNNQNCNTPKCSICPTGKGCKGMAVATAYKALATLNIQDVPLSYSPPVGTDMNFICNYNYLETNQPSTFGFANLTQNWTLNWSAYVTADASNNLIVHPPGGGCAYFNYTPPPDNFTSPYAPDVYTQAQMAQDGGGYQRLLPDGSIEVYGLQDTATSPTSYFLTQVIDPRGNVTSINYGTGTAAYRIASVTDAIGQVTTFTYASTVTSNPGYFQIASISDAFGRSCSFTYDSTNTYLLSITDCIGIQSQFSYLTSGSFIYMMSTPYGVTSFYSYATLNAQNGLITTYPDGTCSQVQSNIGELKTSYFWDREASALYPSDAQNQPPQNAEATVWLIEGGLANGVLSSIPWTVQKQLESLITYTYPGQGLSDNVGNTNKPSNICQGPDSPGPPYSPNNQYYNYQYNVFGYVTQYVDPVGRTFTYKYAANNIDLLEKRQTKGTNNDLLGKWEYNNTQHLPNVYIDGSAQTTQFTYTQYGQPNVITDANGNTVTFNYSGYYLSTIDGPLSGTNDVTTVTFDTFGRVHTVTDSLGYMLTFAYDNMDRLVSTTYPDSTTETTTWYLLNPVIFQDRLGRITQDTYDNMQQRVKNIDSLGRVTQYSWCSCGSISHLIDGNGNETTWNHDIRGREIQKVYADGSETNKTYEPVGPGLPGLGRLSTITDALNQTKTLSYNMDGTISGVSYTNSVNATSNCSYSYDPNYLRLQTATNGWGAITVSYNPFVTDPFATPTTGGGRISTISNNVIANSVIGYVYDAVGRTTSRTVNGSANTDTWTYDAADRVTAESNALGSFTFNYLNPSYGTNQLSSVVYPIGTPTAQTTNFSWYTSSNPGEFEQLQQITNVAGGSAPTNLSQYGYQYNAVQNISQWTQQVNGGATNTISLGYDRCDQLLTATGTAAWAYTFAYDNAANRTSAQNGSTTTTATPNNLNQITSLSGGTSGSLSYDQDGNLTNDNTVTHGYSWDAENRLVKVTYSGTGNNSQLVYDPLGGLVSIVETVGGVTTSTKQFVRTPRQMLETRDATGAVIAQYFSLGQTVAGTSVYYTKDHLGSVRDVTNNTAAVQKQYAYDPYGVPSVSGGGPASDFQYAGYYYHAPSGLNFTQSRAYSPSLGRFINRDPIEEDGSINLYEYVGNNPITLVDVFGLSDVNPTIQGIEDFSRGAADIVDFGVGDALGYARGQGVDPTSSSYVGGQITAGIASLGRVTYAAAAANLGGAGAKTIVAAEKISFQRNQLKIVARLGAFPKARVPNFDLIKIKYGGDAGRIIGAARRTNPFYNFWGVTGIVRSLGSGDCGK